MCDKMLPAAVGFAVLLSVGASAAQVTLSQSVSSDSLAFEDSLTLTVALTWSGGPEAVEFVESPELKVSNLTPAGYTGSTESMIVDGELYTTKTHRYLLKSHLPGPGRIEPLQYEYLLAFSPDSGLHTVTSQAVVVAVGNPAGRPTDIERRSGMGFIWGGLAVLALALAGRLFFFRSRERTRISDSPKDRLLAKLGELKRECGNDIKRFQDGVYRELDRFVDEQYGIRSGSDSGKLASALQAKGVPPPLAVRLAGFVAQAEIDKYRPVSATPGIVLRLEAEVRQCIEQLP